VIPEVRNSRHKASCKYYFEFPNRNTKVVKIIKQVGRKQQAG
jgi:hypothetical protein